MSKAKKTTRTTATAKSKAPKALIFIDANGVEHAPDSEEALERLLPQRPAKNEAAPKKGKRDNDDVAVTPTEAVANTAPHGEELCTFAIRLTRSERDAIHKAAGPAKATKFVKGLAVAAALGDFDAVQAICQEALTK